MSSESRQILVIVLVLVAIGLAFLFSASAVTSEAGRAADPYLFLRKQLVWAGLGAIAMAFCYRVPLTFWMKSSRKLWMATLVLLALCFVPGIGVQLNGAHRWLRAAGWFLQPSEVAKLSLLMLVAAWAAEDPERLKSFARGFVPAFAAIGLTCALIIIEPDLGTTAFLGLVATTTLIVAGVRIAHVLPLGAVAGFGAWQYAVTHPHVIARLTTFRNPDADPLGAGLQIRQSLIALGSGGWFGEGLGRGTGKLWYLPEVHSDFILPLIGQELGFLGTAAVLLLFVALGAAGWKVCRRAESTFGALLAFGITLTIILQAAMNIAVVTASVPTKGIPLPFLSAGGSSLVFTMAAVGILMRVADGEPRPVGEGEGKEAECGSSSRAGERAAISSPA